MTQIFKFSALSLFVFLAYACNKENEPTVPDIEKQAQSTLHLDTSPAQGGADDRTTCFFTASVIWSSMSGWEAEIRGNINGSWTVLRHIGGMGSSAPTRIPDGSSVKIALGDYTELKLFQLNGNTIYRLQSAAGTINRTMNVSSALEFWGGCEPQLSCSSTLRIGSACQTTWTGRLAKRDAFNNLVTIAEYGGTGSNAPIKIPTGSMITIPITGFTDYIYTQTSGTANYIIDTPSGGQSTFTLDVINGPNPCMNNQSLPAAVTQTFGCIF